ncbi:MAG: hypothetical protein ACI8XO_004100 [Verrucomicrobiales bacterium]
MKSPLSSLLKRPLSPDSLAFIASPAGIFSAPHFHSRFPEVPLMRERAIFQLDFSPRNRLLASEAQTLRERPTDEPPPANPDDILG